MMVETVEAMLEGMLWCGGDDSIVGELRCSKRIILCSLVVEIGLVNGIEEAKELAWSDWISGRLTDGWMCCG